MSHETILDLFLWMMLAAAMVGAVVALVVVHLISMRITRQVTTNTVHFNGIDLLAEHHRMKRKPGESGEDLIDRVNASYNTSETQT